MMKPILFNAEMLRAILDGRKTVTRRVVNCKHLRGLENLTAEKIQRACIAPCSIGDILYVRETWGYDKNMWIYRADFSDEDLEKIACITKWHPSIHMPREAARIFLRVTDVRVERLQDSFTKHGGTIFEICAEGINIPEECRDCIDTYGSPCCIDTTEDDGSECGMLDYPRSDFADLWDSTVRNTDREHYGWAANPWVWVIAFERCEKPEEGIDGSI